MKSIDINAQIRSKTGKKDSKELRKQNNVPCVMYGGDEILHFYTHENNFKELIYTPSVFIVHLNIDGKEYKAILQDIQYQPVTDRITHVDFVQVFDDKPLVMNVPVKIIGESVGIKAGGKVRLKRRTIRLKAFLKDLPDALEVDITDLEIGMSIKIQELSYENLEILDPGRAMVVAVISSRMSLKDAALPEDEIDEEEGEAVEGEVSEGEATGEEGDTSEPE
jgi:large subunit ribosomal protein L25